MRHAKSSWENPGLDDFNRPLLQKGISRTSLVSKALMENDFIPDQIISSPAVRALSTANLVIENLNLSAEIVIQEQNLYFRGEEDYFNAVFACSDEINTLMIVGHNPMITAFCNYFLTEKIDNLPTSGIIGLEFETENWEDVTSTTCYNFARYFPKKMKS